MISQKFELIIVIIEDQIERVLRAECSYSGFIEEDGGGVGRKLIEVDVAAFDHLHTEGRNIMVVDPERSHEERIFGVKRSIREPALLPVLSIDCWEVGSDGSISDSCNGEQVFAKIGGTILAERPGAMDDEYLIPIVTDFFISNKVQLAINDECAYDEAIRNKKLKDHQA